MKSRTEELLYFLLWNAEQLTMPSFRNLTDSFEGWAYRKGFLRQLQELEAHHVLERPVGGAVEAIYRLSESGRLLALGGCDPVSQWNRDWDGCWRLVAFDLPELKATARVKLRRFLKDNHFGYLQKSVWISPDPLSQITKQLSACAKDVESLITLEARPGAGETDADIVAGAWDFKRINQLYQDCQKILRQLPSRKAEGGEAALGLRRWAQAERTAWQEAVSADPFLPAKLLPADYLGQEAWRERIQTLAQAGRLIS